MNGLFRIMAVLIFVAANVSAVSAAYTGLGGPDSRVIKGTVVSSEDNAPMDFVNVYALDMKAAGSMQNGMVMLWIWV